jgi:hypothetical protein
LVSSWSNICSRIFHVPKGVVDHIQEIRIITNKLEDPLKIQLLLIVGAICPAFAQSSALPIALGYTEPPAFLAAPGQVVTLFLDDVPIGTDGSFRSAQTPAGALPTSLAGIAVRISQGNSPDMQAGILAIRQQEPCGLSGLQAGDAGCLLTLLKIQVPFELAGDPVSSDQKTYSYAPPALLSIDVDGRRGRGFPLQPVPDNGHVLTTCDASWDTKASSICDRQVYHLDGSVVTEQAPATVGETLHVLFYGLGRTDPLVTTGQASPAGAAITDLIPNVPRVSLGIATNFLNSLSSAPRTSFIPETVGESLVPITSASLVAGQIGICQVSFTIPPVKDAIIPCSAEVKSNSRLIATTSQGAEGIGLCVQQ